MGVLTIRNVRPELVAYQVVGEFSIKRGVAVEALFPKKSGRSLVSQEKKKKSQSTGRDKKAG